MFDSASVAPLRAVIDTAAFCRSMFCFCATTVIDSRESESGEAAVLSVGAGPAITTRGAAPPNNSMVIWVNVFLHGFIARSRYIASCLSECKNRAQWRLRRRKVLGRFARLRRGAWLAGDAACSH